MTPDVPSTPALLAMFVAAALVFSSLSLLAWGAERFIARSAPPAFTPMPFTRALSVALKQALWIFPIVLVLAAGCEQLAKLLGIDAPEQPLVVWMKQGLLSPAAVTAIGVDVALVAPLTEEFFFRRFLFRNILRRTNAPIAAALSSACFALAHANLVSALPLFVLGCAFAAVYRKTGRLGASMLLHSLFNTATFLFLLFAGTN